MVAVVAVDENWGIGCDGELLYHIPEDKKFVREFTAGKVLVMGNATLKSLPGGKPLKNRINIVLSRDTSIKSDCVTVCNSVEELLDTVSVYNPDDVVVFGGEGIYKQLLDHCTAIYVTKIKGSKKADRFFPDLDLLCNWQIESKSEEKEYNGLKYAFYKYIPRNL
ncbi:MAG: dihydrofolate reductase [Oscillospiraceae bacterium]|nr:dihydrofolate reductase [Oscillospiraceae bacterium]